MNTLRYLSDPALRDLFLPGIVTGVALAALCSLLSVLVVLKRLAFIGQGISHAAFGGAGLAAILGLGAAASGAVAARFGVIFAFCLAAAWLIGVLSRRGRTEADTAIGIVLVASMALGAILLKVASSTTPWESFLFGDMLAVSWADAAIAWAAAGVVLAVLWWFRRPLVTWAFDPPVAQALGVPTQAMNLLLLTLLALATVTAMKLAGVVLATALLVLPAAAALRVGARWRPVLVLAGLFAAAGVLLGLVVSFEGNWPPGPSIVAVLAGVFGVAALAGRRSPRAA
jgi:ABC-type Mn2+/Zn2+ transport system permease subunit